MSDLGMIWYGATAADLYFWQFDSLHESQRIIASETTTCSGSSETEFLIENSITVTNFLLTLKSFNNKGVYSASFTQTGTYNYISPYTGTTKTANRYLLSWSGSREDFEAVVDDGPSVVYTHRIEFDGDGEISMRSTMLTTGINSSIGSVIFRPAQPEVYRSFRQNIPGSGLFCSLELNGQPPLFTYAVAEGQGKRGFTEIDCGDPALIAFPNRESIPLLYGTTSRGPL